MLFSTSYYALVITNALSPTFKIVNYNAQTYEVEMLDLSQEVKNTATIYHLS